MTLEELRDKKPPSELLQLSSKDYQKIWISDYWDGPISGMLLFEERYCWFERIQEKEEEEDWTDWYRRFAVLNLSPEQLQKELDVHRDFQQYVGTRWDCLPMPDVPQLIEGQQQVFYDKHLAYCQSRPFEQNEVIAWFEL